MQKKNKMNRYLIFCCIFLNFNFLNNALAVPSDTLQKVKIGIAGLSHGHSFGVFRHYDTSKVEIVGIAESNPALIERFRKQFNLAEDLFYRDMEEMLKETKPQGIAAFTNTYEHLKLVEICAPFGIHVMVEKPLAVNSEHMERMTQLSEKYGIFLITNFETTYHPSLNQAHKLIFEENKSGLPRKIVFHDGNDGLAKGKGRDEFYEWLTDPVLNGGGAIMDFGCYGINILTNWLQGEKPVSVYAETRQFQPDRFPEVDDDATIILNYDSLQCIIMASWNWAFGRKDAEIYTSKGYFIADDAYHYRFKWKGDSKEEKFSSDDIFYSANEALNYFSSLIMGEVKMKPYSPFSLENNEIVTEILDAAKKSASEHKVIFLNSSE